MNYVARLCSARTSPTEAACLLLLGVVLRAKDVGVLDCGASAAFMTARRRCRGRNKRADLGTESIGTLMSANTDPEAAAAQAVLEAVMSSAGNVVSSSTDGSAIMSSASLSASSSE